MDQRLRSLENEILRLKLENEQLKVAAPTKAYPTEVFVYPEVPSDFAYDQKRSLILCGPVDPTDVNPWQKRVIQSLRGASLLIIDTQRKDNVEIGMLGGRDEVASPTNWELVQISCCSAVVFWFSWSHPNLTMTLLELGKALVTKEVIFVGIHPNCEHKRTIEEFVKIHLPDLRIATTVEKLEQQLKYWVIHNRTFTKSTSSDSSSGSR